MTKEIENSPNRFRVPSPRVSVIIPALNEEKLLPFILHRFTEPIVRDLSLEIILSDGGSTDATLKLAQPYVDTIVQNVGPARQTIGEGRNAGALFARGDVLLFFNADVQLPDDAVGFLAELIQCVDRTGVATCRVAVRPDQALLIDKIVLGVCDGFFWLLNKVGLGMGRGECHAVKKSLFDAIGGYNETLVAGEDFDLFHRLASYGRQHKTARISFLWDWVLFEDPRRYRKLGYARTMWLWFQNFLSITFMNKSKSKTWDVIR